MTAKKVLCIEDDTFLLDLISGKLRDVGIEAYVAHSGTEGLASVRENTPDLILLDLMLPDIRGSEVLRVIKEDPGTKKIPVIIFSNLGEKDEIKKSIASGARAYIVKSNTLPGDLIEIVANELGVPLTEAHSAHEHDPA